MLYEFPTWNDCRLIVNAGGKLTPLEEFIFHYEPFSEPESEEFREKLSKLIEFLEIYQ